MYPEERRGEILRLINQSGRASVTELSGQFGVSEVTIRADLQALADRSLLLRTHGGAIPLQRGPYELSLATRRQQQVVEKERIGVAGAAMVTDGDAIFLDSSSTALAIAQSLKQRRYLTIVTNSLIVAQELLDAPGVNVVLLGGTLRRETASLVGGGLDVLRQFNLQRGFFGAHGLSLTEGLTDVSLEEAELKRPLVGDVPPRHRHPGRHEVGPRRAGLVRCPRPNSHGHYGHRRPCRAGRPGARGGG